MTASSNRLDIPSKIAALKNHSILSIYAAAVEQVLPRLQQENPKLHPTEIWEAAFIIAVNQIILPLTTYSEIKKHLEELYAATCNKSNPTYLDIIDNERLMTSFHHILENLLLSRLGRPVADLSNTKTTLENLHSTSKNIIAEALYQLNMADLNQRLMEVGFDNPDYLKLSHQIQIYQQHVARLQTLEIKNLDEKNENEIAYLIKESKKIEQAIKTFETQHPGFPKLTEIKKSFGTALKTAPQNMQKDLSEYDQGVLHPLLQRIKTLTAEIHTDYLRYSANPPKVMTEILEANLAFSRYEAKVKAFKTEIANLGSRRKTRAGDITQEEIKLDNELEQLNQCIKNFKLSPGISANSSTSTSSTSSLSSSISPTPLGSTIAASSSDTSTLSPGPQTQVRDLNEILKEIHLRLFIDINAPINNHVEALSIARHELEEARSKENLEPFNLARDKIRQLNPAVDKVARVLNDYLTELKEQNQLAITEKRLQDQKRIEEYLAYLSIAEKIKLSKRDFQHGDFSYVCQYQSQDPEKRSQEILAAIQQKSQEIQGNIKNKIDAFQARHPQEPLARIGCHYPSSSPLTSTVNASSFRVNGVNLASSDDLLPITAMFAESHSASTRWMSSELIDIPAALNPESIFSSYIDELTNLSMRVTGPSADPLEDLKQIIQAYVRLQRATHQEITEGGIKDYLAKEMKAKSIHIEGTPNSGLLNLEKTRKWGSAFVGASKKLISSDHQYTTEEHILASHLMQAYNNSMTNWGSSDPSLSTSIRKYLPEMPWINESFPHPNLIKLAVKMIEGFIEANGGIPLNAQKKPDPSLMFPISIGNIHDKNLAKAFMHYCSGKGYPYTNDTGYTIKIRNKEWYNSFLTFTDDIIQKDKQLKHGAHQHFETPSNLVNPDIKATEIKSSKKAASIEPQTVAVIPGAKTTILNDAAITENLNTIALQFLRLSQYVGRNPDPQLTQMLSQAFEKFPLNPSEAQLKQHFASLEAFMKETRNETYQKDFDAFIHTIHTAYAIQQVERIRDPNQPNKKLSLNAARIHGDLLEKMLAYAISQAYPITQTQVEMPGTETIEAFVKFHDSKAFQGYTGKVLEKVAIVENILSPNHISSALLPANQLETALEALINEVIRNLNPPIAKAKEQDFRSELLKSIQEEIGKSGWERPSNPLLDVLDSALQKQAPLDPEVEQGILNLQADSVLASQLSSKISHLVKQNYALSLNGILNPRIAANPLPAHAISLVEDYIDRHHCFKEGRQGYQMKPIHLANDPAFPTDKILTQYILAYCEMRKYRVVNDTQIHLNKKTQATDNMQILIKQNHHLSDQIKHYDDDREQRAIMTRP